MGADRVRVCPKSRGESLPVAVCFSSKNAMSSPALRPGTFNTRPVAGAPLGSVAAREWNAGDGLSSRLADALLPELLEYWVMGLLPLPD